MRVVRSEKDSNISTKGCQKKNKKKQYSSGVDKRFKVRGQFVCASRCVRVCVCV